MVRSKMGAVEEESLYLSHCRERKPLLLLLPLSLLGQGELYIAHQITFKNVELISCRT